MSKNEILPEWQSLAGGRVFDMLLSGIEQSVLKEVAKVEVF